VGQLGKCTSERPNVRGEVVLLLQQDNLGGAIPARADMHGEAAFLRASLRPPLVEYCGDLVTQLRLIDLALLLAPDDGISHANAVAAGFAEDFQREGS
jgi:hypothetical protein